MTRHIHFSLDINEAKETIRVPISTQPTPITSANVTQACKGNISAQISQATRELTVSAC